VELHEQLYKLVSGMVVLHAETTTLTKGLNSPLGSFGARITAAFAIGLINLDDYGELERRQKSAMTSLIGSTYI
jgi:hypothetical protein